MNQIKKLMASKQVNTYIETNPMFTTLWHDVIFNEFRGNDELKLSLRQSGYLVHMVLTGYSRLFIEDFKVMVCFVLKDYFKLKGMIMALTVARKANERVIITTSTGETISVSVSRGCKVTVDAPKSVKVMRSELVETE